MNKPDHTTSNRVDDNVKSGAAAKSNDHPMMVELRNYLIAGVATILPLLLTVLVIRFLLNLLGQVGKPMIEKLQEPLSESVPPLANWLQNETFQTVLGVILVILMLIIVGWAATKVVGRRLIRMFDNIMENIPLVKKLYGSVKTLMELLQKKPDEVQRVVLIDFPSPEMKTVGFVTRTLTDADTGQTLAAVYVPTTPNPTSGYLEIVPMERVTSTTWTVDEAMTFIVSGGAIAPSHMNYAKSWAPSSTDAETSDSTGSDNEDTPPEQQQQTPPS